MNYTGSFHWYRPAPPPPPDPVEVKRWDNINTVRARLYSLSAEQLERMVAIAEERK